MRPLLIVPCFSLFVLSLDAQPSSSSELSVITLPVRVHRLVSESEPRLNCTFSEEEIREQFAIVNQTWDQAKIVWEIESIVDAVAPDSDAVTQALDGGQGPLGQALAKNVPKGLLKNGFNLAIGDNFGRQMGGVFMPDRNGIVFYAKFGPKAFGPNGEQTPAVLAHELGHSLGLPHTIFERDNNLMMGGGPERVPTATKPLTRSQIEIARTTAASGKPFSPPIVSAPVGNPNELFKRLDTNGDDSISLEEAEPGDQLFVVDFLRKASRAPSDILTRKQFDFIMQQQARQRQMAQARRQGGSRQPLYGPEIVPQIMNRFDADKDGAVSREEKDKFPASLLGQNFDRWDKATNGDGQLTREEIVACLSNDAEGR